LPDGGSIDDYDFTAPPYDIDSCMTDLVGFLKGEVTAADSYYVNKIAESFSYEEDQYSFALRLVIHYAGDIHQPLHSVAEVNNEYPEGDAGGNYEHIPSVNGVSNLHSVWDSVIYQYTGYASLPFSDSDWDWVTGVAQDLADKYPIDESTILLNQFSTWSGESVELSKEYVYEGFVEGEVPDQTYIDKAIPVCE